MLEIFYDNMRVESEMLVKNVGVPTSIRVLTLDFNFVGKIGADALAQILATSRNLRCLYLERVRIEGRDMQRFCGALARNQTLKVLNLAQNRLGNNGIDLLGEAL